MAQLIQFTLQASIFLTVFTLGLDVTITDLLSLVRRPSQLFRSFLAMDVAMPILALVLAMHTHLDPAVKISLLVLSVSPVPPILPTKGARAGGRHSYMYGLLVTAALLSMIVTPLAVDVMSAALGADAHVRAGAVAVVISKTVLLPIAIGATFRWLWPSTAERIGGPLGETTRIVLFSCAVLLLLGARQAIGGVMESSTIAAIVAFSAVGLIVGHLLGGPDERDRTFLALATSSRHPGVALTIAQAVAPDARLVAAVVLLYLLVSVLAGIPYLQWRNRRRRMVPPQPIIGSTC